MKGASFLETAIPLIKQYSAVQFYKMTLKITRQIRTITGGLYLSIMMAQMMTALSVFSVLLMAGIGIQYALFGLYDTWPWQTFLWLGISTFVISTSVNIYLYKRATSVPEKMTEQSYAKIAAEIDKLTDLFMERAKPEEPVAPTLDLDTRLAKLESSIRLLSEAVKEVDERNRYKPDVVVEPLERRRGT